VNVDEEEIIAIMAMYAVNHISNPTCMVIDTFVDSIHQHAIVTLYLRIFFFSMKYQHFIYKDYYWYCVHGVRGVNRPQPPSLR